MSNMNLIQKTKYIKKLTCKHANGFKGGYCIDCEIWERYTEFSHSLFLAGERYDIGLITVQEYDEALDKFLEFYKFPHLRK